MKKVISCIVVMALIFSSSCNKNSSGPLDVWSFEGSYYNATAVVGTTGIFNATNVTTQNASSFAQISCFFYQDSLPTSAGNYTVVSGTPGAHQVAIKMSLNANMTNYTSTGGNGTQTIAVSISGGKVTLIGTGITLANFGVSPVDSSATLNLNLTQQ